MTTWFHQVDVYLLNNSSRVSLLVLVICMVMLTVSWGAWHVRNSSSSTTMLYVARSAGRTVTIMAGVLIVSGAQSLWTFLRKSRRLSFWLPFNYIMPFLHRLVAYTVALAGALHAFAQLYNYSRNDITWNKGIWSDDDESLPTIQLFVTGIVLQCMMAAIICTTSRWFRRRFFNMFWHVHVAGIVVVFGLLLVHGSLRGRPFSYIFVTPCLALYAASKWYQHVHKSVELAVLSARLSECRRVVRLELAGKPWSFEAGQFAHVVIPAINGEAHSFTIASAPQDRNLVFFIAAVGAWTSTLLKLVESGQLPTTVNVRGPFGAPTDHYKYFPRVVLIGTGVGATPMVSVMSELDHRLVTARSEKQLMESAAGQLQVNDEHKHDLTANDQREKEQATLWHVHTRANIIWRQQVTHSHHAALRFVNRISVLYAQLYILVLSTALSASLGMFRRRAALIPPLISETVSILCFGIRCVGFSAFLPKWYKEGSLHVLRMPILLSVMAFVTAVVHMVVTISAFTSNNENDELSNSELFADLGLDVLQFVLVYIVLIRDLRANVYPLSPRAKNAQRIVPRSVHFVWVVKSLDSCWWLERLNRIASHVTMQIDVYVTRHDIEADGPLPDNTTMLKFHTGRPDWRKLISVDSMKFVQDCDVMGVFFCGAPIIGEDIVDVCDDIMRKNKRTRIIFHEEAF